MTAKHLFVRSLLTLAMPFILVWAFIAELLHGIKSAFVFAWLEVRINFSEYLKQMERTDY